VLFADHLSLEQGLAEALDGRPPGTPALDVLREFVVENLSRFDEQARIRWQIVRGDELLLAHQRARQAALGELIARAIAADLGERPDVRAPLPRALPDGVARTGGRRRRRGDRVPARRARRDPRVPEAVLAQSSCAAPAVACATNAAMSAIWRRVSVLPRAGMPSPPRT